MQCIYQVMLVYIMNSLQVIYAYATSICTLSFLFLTSKQFQLKKKKITSRQMPCECPHPYMSKSATTRWHKSPPYNS